MVEELEKSIKIQPHSVDVLVSEWMGYCLLYESMLTSVLYARDRWLKPGGAILPDTATMFVAGFGKGATSLPFWEDVYGFDMSSIGKEILEDTARIPIVDVIEERDLVTQPALLQSFDLATMKPDEVDFTATATLEPTEAETEARLCHGVVLWFDTGFTDRFCKENPTVLSTSPYTPPTHWAQTVLTFQEPISLAPATVLSGDDRRGAVGTKECPASSIQLRVSVARASEHRSIDVSLEATGVSSKGQKRRWPAVSYHGITDQSCFHVKFKRPLAIAKDNKVFNDKEHNGVLEVANSMVEELEKSIKIQPHSVDVLVSEWMGYCLLYESMLTSVLYARDRWLKPGGAILPDTATMFVAGFGKGATSLPFWEDVYGFDMSSIGKEILEDTARIPIVDVIEERDLVTQPALLQSFDLAAMKQDEVDFTATATLEPTEAETEARLCHGVVLWFDTGFTDRFCKENPTVLSTSPYTPPTHWAQTVLTFQEPISVAPATVLSGDDRLGAVGTKECPASSIQLRVSVARASEHRSIDVSLEATGVSSKGQKRRWPVHIFNL
ncbi:hypothetical protein DY000_02050824 [Brassica cretica]|uniref:Protein arginine N-methyltransferase domain-containing protein n=1 Tax=Brassica cretica TaxID=69181 RepID=A0ABQ7EX09_BRACR|nr:hypothetical protein DY000_02050824 [Brassica cretica]